MQASETTRRRAFGLEIRGDFYAPGLRPSLGEPIRAVTDVVVSDPEAVIAGWPDTAEELVKEYVGDDPRPRIISRDQEAGWLFVAPDFGYAKVAPSGRHIICAPHPPVTWRWQRFLIGRVLPYAAVLQGLEPLHASAVAIGDRAVGVVGPSGAGKTSIAIRLVLAGADFMSDDVVTLELRDGLPIAHAGAGTVSIRDAEHELLSEEDVGRIGQRLGSSAKHDVEVGNIGGPRPLASLYFLEPSDNDTAAIRPFERNAVPAVLGQTFVHLVRAPERLIHQLEVATAIATTTHLWRLGIAPGRSAGDLARAIIEHEASL